jgi:hypothetical protein
MLVMRDRLLLMSLAELIGFDIQARILVDIFIQADFFIV